MIKYPTASERDRQIDQLKAELREARQAGVDILAKSHQWQDRAEKAEAAIKRVRDVANAFDRMAKLSAGHDSADWLAAAANDLRTALDGER